MFITTDITDFAHELADKAGMIALQYFRQPVDIDYKSDASPVTRADREIEAALVAAIAARYGDKHGILGEESGASNLSADYVWVIDPIDGTRAFIAGKPTFSTLIALCYKGKPILGVIDQPVVRDRWVGIERQGTTLNGEPVKTRHCPDLSQALLSTTSPEYFSITAEPAFLAVRASVRDVLYGCDGYAYGLLARGSIDVVIESNLKPYDFCALAPVINGAGGMITDWRGEPLSLHSNGDVLACGDKSLHANTLGLIALPKH